MFCEFFREFIGDFLGILEVFGNFPGILLEFLGNCQPDRNKAADFLHSKSQLITKSDLNMKIVLSRFV